MASSKIRRRKVSGSVPGLRHSLRLFLEGSAQGNRVPRCASLVPVKDGDGEQEVIAPFTPRQPQRPEDAIEILPATRQRLDVDSERSWIVITEADEFSRPGLRLRAAFGRDDTTTVHGALPPKLFIHVRNRVLERVA